MANGEALRNLFETWPAAIPRQGLLVTIFDETIPFINYMCAGDLLLIERDRPDQVGARKVILPYEVISAIKLGTTLDLGRFAVMGFQAPP